MNALWQTPVIVMVVLGWLAEPPRSLADAARRESVRRAATPPSKATLSNLGRPPELALSAMLQAQQAARGGDPDKTAGDAKKAEGGDEAAKADVKKDEAWWRKRVASARDALAQSERTIQALESRINALRRDVVNLDNPVQRSKAKQELQQAIADQDQARRDAASQRQAIADIQDEARREGVPAGWVRFD